MRRIIVQSPLFKNPPTQAVLKAALSPAAETLFCNHQSRPTYQSAKDDPAHDNPLLGSIFANNAALEKPLPSLEEASPPAALEELIPGPTAVDFGRYAKPAFVKLDFDNAQEAFRSKSSLELMRSLAVFKMCGIKPIVTNADMLLRTAKRVFGQSMVDAIVRPTFFKQFCAGENPEDVQASMKRLHEAGVGGIMDYAAEDDVEAEKGPASRSSEKQIDSVIARTYSYESEKKCDTHVAIFKHAIDAAAALLPHQGFAAVKVTALGNPLLLERVSTCIVELRNLFHKLDSNNDGLLTRAGFKRNWSTLLTTSRPKLDAMFAWLDEDDDGQVDMIEFMDKLPLQSISELVMECKSNGPLSAAALDEEEILLLGAMLQRLHSLADHAAASGVKLMIDAEHSYFQPAIDHAAATLMRKYNVDTPVIYNTYQCYLKGAEAAVRSDMLSAKRYGYKFGAKLVRGAYMVLERNRAKELGLPCPIHDTIEDTHACYDAVLEGMLPRVKIGEAEVILATHNRASIELATERMHAMDVDPATGGVFFGQLLGMADHLTFQLGAHHYRAYKYVPFGPIAEVMPYLIRRAQENSAMMDGVGSELGMMRQELWRRAKGLLGLGRPAPAPTAVEAASEHAKQA